MAQANSLQSIGYREVEREVSANDIYSAERAGIYYASYSGGTDTFIRGEGFSSDPLSNKIFLHSVELKTKIPAPALTEDDSFNSNTVEGILAYRLPALEKLFGISDEVIKTYAALTFIVSVEVDGKMLECST